MNRFIHKVEINKRLKSLFTRTKIVWIDVIETVFDKGLLEIETLQLKTVNKTKTDNN